MKIEMIGYTPQANKQSGAVGKVSLSASSGPNAGKGGIYPNNGEGYNATKVLGFPGMVTNGMQGIDGTKFKMTRQVVGDVPDGNYFVWMPATSGGSSIPSAIILVDGRRLIPTKSTSANRFKSWEYKGVLSAGLETELFDFDAFFNVPPPPPEPLAVYEGTQILPGETYFVNMYNFVSKDGGLTFERILISSGKITAENLASLVNNQSWLESHEIEFISENEVDPPDLEVTPQNPFVIIDGEKVFLNEINKVTLTENIGVGDYV